MLNKNTSTIMNTTITLSAEQISLLLQVLSEQVSQFRIEPSEQDLAEEVLEILEEADDKITSLF
jgi:hypothetical protein